MKSSASLSASGSWLLPMSPRSATRYLITRQLPCNSSATAVQAAGMTGTD